MAENTPQLIEKRISYSVGAKINLGNYESGDVHVSESETWNVSEMDADLVDDYIAGCYAQLRQRVDERANAEIAELRG